MNKLHVCLQECCMMSTEIPSYALITDSTINYVGGVATETLTPESNIQSSQS